MDSTLPSNVSSEKMDSQARLSNKSNRKYRTKKRDESDNEDSIVNDNDQNVMEQEKSSKNEPSASASSITSSSSPYVQSQNSQSLGEVYPGLSRLSFVDQEMEQSSLLDNDNNGPSLLGSKKPHRPLQQKQSIQSQGTGEGGQDTIDTTTATTTSSSSSPAVKIITRGIPPANSPSILSSVNRSGSNLIEIKDTGLPTRGRGMFSVASEVLKPGSLVFKELGYCQVVNDASLSKVCSACFKDVRDEVGEDETTSSVSSGDQRKLVRCAGCHITWYCNKTCQTKDWKLHHQLECEGIRKSKSNPNTAEIWTKRTFDTTTSRAISRMIRRRERVKTSVAYQAKNGKLDPAQKQVNDVYFSGLDEKEERWLDEHGYSWIDKYLLSYEKDRSEKGTLEESSKLTRTMALVMSCVTAKENRHAYFNGLEDTNGTKGFDLFQKLGSYGFSITNLETTATVGLALYVQCIPFMNHSCVPNCLYTFKGSRIECRAIRDIQPGEELTISYIDQIDVTKVRQKQLMERYQFTCECPLCKYYPANPLAQVEKEPLKEIISESLPEPKLDPKQGFICPNLACNGSRMPGTTLAIESQLSIYNKVEIKCKECGQDNEITQELVQENEENTERIISAFIREMNGGSVPGSSKANSRKFELTRVKATPDEANENAVPGGMKTAQEPSAQALQYFDDAYKLLTGVTSTTVKSSGSTESESTTTLNQDPVCHSQLHHLVRRLEQTGFDEAVNNKNWIFALRRSIELERILNMTYIGHHPVKTIQSYYTCKIANLLANLLLEESTVQIEDSEPEESSDDGMLDTDDENELKSWRDAIRKGDKSAKTVAALGSGSMQEQLQEKTMKRSKKDGTEKKKQEKKAKRHARTESSKELLRYLKTLIPKLEDPQILQGFKICWGKDGKFAIRYRYQIDSLKQALHYAELPFANPQEQ
ncbi:hypothetical protein BGZ76_011436 [Entomortierella beljakovae]|nr:hypothetical protein BGZ76_011436 [Entomortierella beljakovae]